MVSAYAIAQFHSSVSSMQGISLVVGNQSLGKNASGVFHIVAFLHFCGRTSIVPNADFIVSGILRILSSVGRECEIAKAAYTTISG